MADFYLRSGRMIAARRWRGRGGEIDLIARDGAAVIFVEVKRAETHAIAAERLTQRQMARISAAAIEFVANEPAGQDTEMAFHAALVDGSGRIDIIENAIGF
ncbi:MAG: YraN family protein [Paracoccaceae bacterium]